MAREAARTASGRPPSFFFQAEDGIRGLYVTGVRRVLFRSILVGRASRLDGFALPRMFMGTIGNQTPRFPAKIQIQFSSYLRALCVSVVKISPCSSKKRGRSEERRVGKE